MTEGLNSDRLHCISFFKIYFSDLSKDEISFGRGENCDIPFMGPAVKKHKCFQAYSKVHFKLIRVGG